jgi:lyso-ornithine lipid O-acyltransferase
MLSDAWTPARLVLRGALFMLLIVLGTLPTVLCQNRLGRAFRIGNRRLDEITLNAWAAALCRIFGVRIAPLGPIAPPPVLVVANHISWLDIFVIYSLAQTGFVSKAEVGRWPVIGLLARVAGTVFHERGSHDSASSVTAAMARRLEEGGRVAIFPEGGIRPGEGVKVFHARLFRPAVEAGCPVQPVMIRYLRDGAIDLDMSFYDDEHFVMNFLRLLGRPSCTCEVQFLAPLPAAGRPRRELALEAQAAVTDAYLEPA